jgi:RNA polymerase sigma-70 factor (ECF subfamily)
MSDPLEETLRIAGARTLATLVRLTGRFDLAEDALHDAMVVALEKRASGLHLENPAGWLSRVARNKALDRLRREGQRSWRESEAMQRLLDERPDPDEDDDLLRMIFTCCHPALAREAQVSLCLRTLGGLSMAEIARAFLTSPETMSQRILRTKRKIQKAAIGYRIPDAEELPERLDAVLAVLYLIFTTGHHAPGGELRSRADLAREAIRLARWLDERLPERPEVLGLLALMLATDARRATRVDGEGRVIPLRAQDRTRWDRDALDEARRLLARVAALGATGPYQIQAAIACLHCEAVDFEATDWRQIAALYRALEWYQPTPVVRVNRAVAEAELSGPATGLALLEDLESLRDWHFFWAARGEFLARLDLPEEAAQAYRRALGCGPNEAERRFFEQRVHELGAGPERRATHPHVRPARRPKRERR